MLLKYEPTKACDSLRLSTTFVLTHIHLDCFSLMSVSVFVKLMDSLNNHGARLDPTFKKWIVTATRKLENTPAEFA